MVRKCAIALILALVPTLSHAITPAQATAEAEAWVLSRQEVILDRVMECITENPRLCHTAWAASVTPNTAPTDLALATVTLDDPGRLADTVCGTCFTGEGTFAQAGINIPATAPVNAKLNIARAPAGWGAQLVIRIRYNLILYERAWGRGEFDGFDWREVDETP